MPGALTYILLFSSNHFYILRVRAVPGTREVEVKK